MTLADEEAAAYWADKLWKKWVVTLERGPRSRPDREVKYVRAKTHSNAIACARQYAMQVKTPSRVSCRLATAYDLGCVRVESGERGAVSPSCAATDQPDQQEMKHGI